MINIRIQNAENFRTHQWKLCTYDTLVAAYESCVVYTANNSIYRLSSESKSSRPNNLERQAQTYS